MSRRARRNAILGLALALVGVCLATVIATLREAPLDGVASLGTSYRLLLAADGALLLLAVDGWRRRSLLGWAIAGLFLLALSFRGLALPLAAVVATDLFLRAREDTRSEATGRVPIGLLGASLLLAIGVASQVSAHHAEASPPPVLDRISYELGRGNLYRARAAALAGTKEEPVPGAAYLALAEIDLRLGLDAKARKVLEKVIARSEDSALKARAESLLNAVAKEVR